MSPRIVIICGPTASGKSALAIAVAQSAGGVIINADSQQQFRELRILTARPTPEEEASVPHRLFGTIPVTESPSVGKWLQMARMEIDWVLSQGKLPVVVGGTGLYVKALMEGIAEVPEVPPEIRQQATSDFETMGKEAFAERLKAVDPEFFERLKVYDRQRLIRAWEVWLASGKSLSWWQKQSSTPPYAKEIFKLFQMDIDRDELYRRCDERFGLMLEQGAMNEVKKLINIDLPEDSPALKPVGVRELMAHLKGEITLEEASRKARQATRNYAKRQITWLNNQFPGTPRVKNAAEILKL